MDKNLNMNDKISFKDSHGEKHGLRGHVSIYREDPETKELSLWDESDNIIPISGYQWILMKMFNLYLDSPHKIAYESDKPSDSTIDIPDLNNGNQLNIGVDPTGYTPMDENIASNHYVQGFMIGNGAGAEDGITAKNTDYSFIKLRNPIPFQQVSSFDSSIANKYLGCYRNTGSSVKSYYIKKFDKTPHIVHSWWRSGQAWDYVDPVNTTDLGPDARTAPKTDRIESYITCSLSINATDCQAFFENEGNNQSPVINELGLVAFDANIGEYTKMEMLYNQKIKALLNLIFKKFNVADYTSDDISELNSINEEILTIMEPFMTEYSQDNIDAFYSTLIMIRTMISAETMDWTAIRNQLSLDTNIEVVAYYNQGGIYQYESDKFIDYLGQIEYEDSDEAQRIKLITYYTFKSIPIQSNSNWKIDYRLFCS